ncbi:MAG: SUMF1/EgtB/PvdO family nonheme iron enzyme, partial [Bacteroidaceae bacterium]|nr:SUMF1/EgtB/PvdO family nonheme iron enzyme [Bacteroidaceae bacterium]
KLDLQCINCHLDAGHYDPNYKHEKMTGAPIDTSGVAYDSATVVKEFKNFTETVPTTHMSINMVAIPGGTFEMGSNEGDAYSQADEYPKHKVTVSPFFMAELEITWNQYWAFYLQTMSEGRTPPEKIYANNTRPDVDVISGPTPPFGAPDQGWGMGDRPAITMTHYAAQTFCQWLSLKTGKKYRLPTEAEWEYAARGGTDTPYFFEGKPGSYTNEGFWAEFFGADTTTINGFAIYANNSKARTQEPTKVMANPFGLKNMLGNVMEYCQDFYAEDAYSKVKDGAVDPKGPESGEHFVVRGGNYQDDAKDLRCAARRRSDYETWLKTDPQKPKSIWWLSDMKGIGFRVVCEVPEGIQAK